MSELDAVRTLAGSAAGALERSRQRIDDLNVYPVPDGDTGTNLTLTVRAVLEALGETTADERTALAKQITRAALMGARGNSGVILSQIVRGAAEVLGSATGRVDADTFARALRAASEAAYRAVRQPVEGTMLTVIREMAEEAEDAAASGATCEEMLSAVVRRGIDAVERTPDQLAVLREAGVVDAGGAGLLELARGLAAGVSGEPLPEVPAAEEHELGVQAIHQELSRYRYCTVFVIEGEELDRGRLEEALERLGDSLLVVGDQDAIKVHVHTDEPGAALQLGTAVGVVEGIEIANMHRQTMQREGRLLQAAPEQAEANETDVVAVVAGTGNRLLFESLGATQIVEGGQTMNPSTQELLAAVESAGATEVILLPNNSNVLMSADQAAELAEKPVQVIRTRSIPEGLAAMVVFDATKDAETNVREMSAAVEAVVTGEVTVASRDAQVDGFEVRKGAFLGLANEEVIAVGATFDEVADAVVDRLLAEPREVMTLLTGEDEPPLVGLLERIAERHPGLELDVQEGGQPHYQLLLSAE